MGKLAVEEIRAEVFAHLSDDVKAQLENRLTEYVVRDKDNKILTMVSFVSFAGDLSADAENVKSLAGFITDYVKAFQVRGMLGEPIRYPLHPAGTITDLSPQPLTLPGPATKALYLVYLAFTPEAFKIVSAITKGEMQNPFVKVPERLLPET